MIPRQVSRPIAQRRARPGRILTVAPSMFMMRFMDVRHPFSSDCGSCAPEGARSRVAAVAQLKLGARRTDGLLWFFRLGEKAGSIREILCWHDLEGYVQAYIRAASIADEDAAARLFRRAQGKTRVLTRNGVREKDVLRMVKRRFKKAGLPPNLTYHTFRATTITDLPLTTQSVVKGFLDRGINPDDVQHLAGQADPRTTKLYDRRKREVTRNIAKRISV